MTDRRTVAPTELLPSHVFTSDDASILTLIEARIWETRRTDGRTDWHGNNNRIATNTWNYLWWCNGLDWGKDLGDKTNRWTDRLTREQQQSRYQYMNLPLMMQRPWLRQGFGRQGDGWMPQVGPGKKSSSLKPILLGRNSSASCDCTSM